MEAVVYLVHLQSLLIHVTRISLAKKNQVEPLTDYKYISYLF